MVIHGFKVLIIVCLALACGQHSGIQLDQNEIKNTVLVLVPVFYPALFW